MAVKSELWGGTGFPLEVSGAPRRTYKPPDARAGKS